MASLAKDWKLKSEQLCRAIDILREALDVLTIFENLHAKAPRSMRKVADKIIGFLDDYDRDR